jgi:Tol biopolymer transport system component
MLAYRCGRGICTMQADGRNKRKLAPLGGGPAFSPDGRRIIYAVPGNHSAVIYAMNADGNKKRQLTQSRWLSLAPALQPLPK